MRPHFRFPAVLALCVIGQLAFAQSTHQEHIHGDDLEERLDARDARLEGAIMGVKAGLAEVRNEIRQIGTPGAAPVVEPRIEYRVRLPEIDEVLTFSYSFVDDGSCSDATHALSGEYRGNVKPYGLNVGAYARIAPTGGNCLRDGITYRMSVDKDFAIGDGRLSATARFLADSRSTSGMYALMDEAGMAVLLREDGNALLTNSLPAGIVDTVIAALGFALAVGEDGRLTAGGNIVPVDWADGSRTQTAHIAYDFPLGSVFGGSLGISGSVDVGNVSGDDASAFGVSSLRWRRNDFSASLRYAFGLNEIDGGEPAEQEIQGAAWALQGSPLDDSLTFEIGLSF